MEVDIKSSETPRLFAIINPVAGTAPVDEIRNTLEQHLSNAGWSYEFYETTGGEQVTTVAHEAVRRGFSVVAAVGGDGTVSEVASGLVGTDAVLGIVPTGTANVLAQELGIPLNIDAACRLLIDASATTSIDGMQIQERYFFLQIGIGLDSLMIRDTSRQHKRRFGRVAYLWTGITRLLGFQPARFTIVTDGKQRRSGAVQVLIANGGAFGVPQLRWGPDIYPDDGSLTVCVIYSRNLLNYLRVAWYILTSQQKRSRTIRYYHARQNIIINADKPLPIQADGEIIGDTPVQVRVVPGAVRVIVPETEHSASRKALSALPSAAEAVHKLSADMSMKKMR